MSNVVYGAYENIEGAITGVAELIRHGSLLGSIGVITTSGVREQRTALLRGATSRKGTPREDMLAEPLGQLLEKTMPMRDLWTVGLEVVASGPVLTALEGATAGVRKGGGLSSVLAGVGIPSAKAYEDLLRRGGIIVAVATDTDESGSTAASLFDKTGAIRVDKT
jgi:hypothetical protein